MEIGKCFQGDDSFSHKSLGRWGGIRPTEVVAAKTMSARTGGGERGRGHEKNKQ